MKAIGYEGAGTLEFLLDAQGNFYFMEMNTRLQVEHPVTEAITGLDLVELQLRIAAGEPLPLRQDDVTFKGHAIEVRLCSEDADKDFMPQSGRMALWRMPGELRVEHALQSGSEISPYYDSMIAKIIAVGASRDEARRKLIHGLDNTVAFGVTTNRGFLAACLRHEVFARGEATTAFIAQNRDALSRALPDDAVPAARWRRCCSTSPIRTRSRIGRAVRSPRCSRRLLRFELDGSRTELRGAAPARRQLRRRAMMAARVALRSSTLSGDSIRFQAEDFSEFAVYHRDGDRLFVQRLGVANTIVDLTRAAPQRAAAAGGDGKLRAALNGRVVAVLVQVRRHGRGRPAGADAGGDEDGARASGAGLGHHRRSTSPKASR